MTTRTGIVALSLAACVGFGACIQENERDFRGPREDLPHAKKQAGYIVVDLADGTTKAEYDQWESQWGVDVEFNSVVGEENGVTLAAVQGDPEAVLARIRQHPAVEAAEPVYLYSALWKPDDPGYPKQWHFAKVHAEDAWELANGSGVTVAVIDTGVAYRDFGDRFKIGEDLAKVRFSDGYDFVNDRPEAVDDNGHGTHVAGTIAEGTNNGIGPAGLAWGATIMPLKVLSGAGFGNTADIADAIRWAADHGANVINMSLGGGGFSQVMFNAIQYARGKGVVVVAAAGNSAVGQVDFPGAYDGVIAVSATNDQDKLAPYSSWGKAVDVAAPGGDTSKGESGGVYQNIVMCGFGGEVVCTYDYRFLQGTSMASPHVAAVAALVMSVGVTRPAAVERILLDSARAAEGQKGRNDRFGHGIVDASAAAGKARFELGLGRTAALLALLVLLWFGRRRSVGFTPGFLVAAGLTGVGLFFLPWILPPFFGRALLDTPLADWGLHAFGAGGHSNLLLWSAALPLALVAVTYSARRLRPVVGGFCVGTAAFLLHAMVSGHADVGWLPGRVLAIPWLGFNGLVALGLGWMVTRKGSTA